MHSPLDDAEALVRAAKNHSYGDEDAAERNRDRLVLLLAEHRRLCGYSGLHPSVSKVIADTDDSLSAIDARG